VAASDTIKSMDHLLNALVTALPGLLTLVTYAHDPRIRSWDGTTLRLEWDGSNLHGDLQKHHR
jgi:hypothetical protein